ncbi:MAG: DUF2634 domain-containing protein [Ruminococcaceae bacterium]|jgi:hypothetical protein|nr:DUF2634 domain-containing protein [Oscillospiraceae bacterium]
MIPYSDEPESFELTDEPQATRTYKLFPAEHAVAGLTGGVDALRQAIFLMLSIERYENLIFSWNYGLELADLFGMPKAYVESELKQRIPEALLQDDRINRVDGFSFEEVGNKITAYFTVHSVYGDLQESKEVGVA